MSKNARTLITIVSLGVSSLAALAAEGPGNMNFRFVDQYQAEKEVGSVLPQPYTLATIYLWSDKYVYRPGENITLRMTSNPNNDLFPYTLFAYRQNNQTGQKFYLPGGTEQVTDIFGSTAAQGYKIVRIPTATKQVLVGAGGLFGQMTIPNELGMHTLTLEVRDYTANRVIKAAYMKIGVVDGLEDISGEITANRSLVNTKAYTLRGNVFVRNNSTLTIDPGTIIVGAPGTEPASLLVVTRGSKLVANGTRSRPIIFTSARPFGQRARGDWGGIVLLGRAPVNLEGGQGTGEGLPSDERGFYGGTDPNDSCGSLQYVRVEFAGVRFTPTNELNGVAWHGCGKGTVSDFIQSHYGQDDGFEWFGGTNDGKHLVNSYNADDLLDWTFGWNGRLQYFVGVQNEDPSGNGIEADNSELNFSARPTASPQIYNLTLVGNNNVDDSSRGILFRRGTGGSVNNVIVTKWRQAGLRIVDNETLAQVDNLGLTMDGAIYYNNNNGAPNTVEGQIDSAPGNQDIAKGNRGKFTNIQYLDPMLLKPFDYNDPDFRYAPGSPAGVPGTKTPPDDGFFDTSAKFLGAVGEDNWLEEWTNFLQDKDIAP
jgi:hypothetical protein